MTKTVKEPPQLGARETGSWCFAAAEVMLRADRGLNPFLQYQIAQRSTHAHAHAHARPDSDVREDGTMAGAPDDSKSQGEDGAAHQTGQVVQMIRTRWNVFDHGSTGGGFIPILSDDLVCSEIDKDRIVVIFCQ
ncbi:hypothetical protein FE840_009605 [Peteryoungia desertarenae]|uniref:Uncharacterized protein n=1 Tax=Peteryoungia desertarenae TaxID=1813451 RepID=A0ABX6QMN3_9HYPH|nr:hypothetical protein [Peteryoungia desertarenae]QLF69778.1 hypothetical protein FE840_009605 [Peteryoungia desertarenae]